MEGPGLDEGIILKLNFRKGNGGMEMAQGSNRLREVENVVINNGVL